MHPRGIRYKRNASLDSSPLDLYREPGYPACCQLGHLVEFFHKLHENTPWNLLICGMVLFMLVFCIVDLQIPETTYLHVTYDVVYLIHVGCIAFAVVRMSPSEKFTLCMKVAFVLDLLTYIHHAILIEQHQKLRLVCYYLRLHRPFRYIYKVDNDSMQGSLLITALKIVYTCIVIRITCAYVWLYIDSLEDPFVPVGKRMLASAMELSSHAEAWDANSTARRFFVALYVINKVFIPIGPSMSPSNDLERAAFLVVMMAGCLAVTGAAVASLSAVISIQMRPEEEFRTRYRLIIQDMKKSHIPQLIRDKVETFYKMYWHKQRAVSATQLLPTFPHVLPKSVHTDIYFEAIQKTRLLRDLTYQFLYEVAQMMETIHFIPGDAIIKRNSKKNSIIYIAYGDIEMLTAEDDLSPILRFTRGTILTPFGACAAGGGRAHVAMRAATFCTAHVLRAEPLWRVALMHRDQGQNSLMMHELNSHLTRVRMHNLSKPSRPLTKFKSSIMHLKKTLTSLKEARDAGVELLLLRSDYFLELSGCYVMRNRADASLADDTDPICLRQTFPWILQPTSSLLTAWNWVVTLFILIICISVRQTYPYYLVFRKDVPLEFYFFDSMMTAVYIIDIFAFLSTGANVEEGVPITFLQTSSVQVRNYWFALDLLATVPVFMFVFDGKFNGINKILRLPKVFHMMKSLEGEYVYHSNVIRFLSYTLLLIIACYLFAALQQAFMCFRYRYCIVSNFTHQPFWKDAPLNDDTVFNRLTFGLYWATSMITFTAHLETWGVENLSNMLYTMLVLEVAIVLHICIEAVYSATIMVSNAFREDYDGCIASVQNFLIRNEADPVLQNRFITYLKLCWYTDKAYAMTTKQSSVFYDLPSHVYQDILARQRSKYILCIPFMKLLHKEDLKNISSEARMFCTSPNEILLNTGDISNEMYVIRQGMCQILSPDTKSVVGTLEAKSHFGVIECLFRLPAFYTVLAITHVQVFSISRKHLTRAVQLPQIKDAMDYAKEQAEYSNLHVRRERFVYYKPPAPAPMCEKFRLPRKHETDYDFLQPFKRLAFFSVLRYVFPRYTFRPDAPFLSRYEVFRAGCALATALLFPSYTYMVLQWPWLYFLTVLLDLFAIADVLFRMLVGYFDENGLLVYHPASTAAHYMKGAFLLDLFSCLPLENLEASNRYSYGNYYQVTAAKQVLMLNRVLQLYRLPGALGVLTGTVERQDFILVLKILPLFLMVLNVLTSLLVFCSARIYCSADARSWLIVPLDDPGGSWIHLFNNAFRFNMTSTPWNLHLTCYFWIVYESTTTGYNNLRPSNQKIIYVLFVSMILGSMFMTYASVRIISIRANVNKVLAAYQENMKDLVQFMKNERLSTGLQRTQAPLAAISLAVILIPLLRRELMDYYEYNWDKSGGVDYRHVLKLCDQITLRTDAILHLYGPAFAKCPILSRCDVALLRILGRAVRSVYFLRNTHILAKDDVVQDLYIVDSGRLHVRSQYQDKSTSRLLSIGSVFGNLDDEPAATMTAEVVAKTDVHLLQMSSAAFHHIIKDCDFPVVLALMRRYRPYNEMYIQGVAPLRGRAASRVTTAVFSRSRRRIVKYLHIKNSLVQSYLIIISMLCVYTDVYNMGFQDNSTPLISALYAFDVGFFLKILLHYFLPRIVEDNTDTKIMVTKIQMKYFKGEFKYDVASLIPIELLSYIPSQKKWLMFSWLRLNRMFRIITIYSSTKVFRQQVTRNLILSAFSLVLWFTLFVHASACLWYFIGALECEAGPRTCWLYDKNDKLLCHNQYICSLYFVLTTFSQNGVGDILPTKQSEVLFVSMLQVLTTMVYMVYVGEFINIIQYASFRSFSYYCKFQELQKFMKNNRVSAKLVRLVNQYSVHLWRATRGQQLPYFLIKAPRCLKLKVMAAVYMADLKRHPVFLECEPAMLRQLVGYLRQYYYDEEMFVVKESEITDSMYLVHTGKVEEISETPSETFVPKVYNSGEYFGVFQGLVRNQPFPYSYRTLEKSQVLTLRLDDWEHLLKYFPASKDSIHKYQQYNNDDDRKDGPKTTLESQMDDKYKPSDKSPDALDGMPGTSEPSMPISSDKTNLIQRQLHFKDEVRKQPYAETPRHSHDRRSSQRQSFEMAERELNLEELSEVTKPTSSTLLFEKIAKEAAAVESASEAVSITPSQNRVIPLDQQSVEDYLRDKHKMRETSSIDIFESRKSSDSFYDELDETEARQMKRDFHVRYESEIGSRRESTLSSELLKDVLLHRRVTLSPQLRSAPELRNQFALDSDVISKAVTSNLSSTSSSSTPPRAPSDTAAAPSGNRSLIVTSKENLTRRLDQVSQSTNLLAIEHLESIERSHEGASSGAEYKENDPMLQSEDPDFEALRKERKSMDLHKKVSFEKIDGVTESEKKLSIDIQTEASTPNELQSKGVHKEKHAESDPYKALETNVSSTESFHTTIDIYVPTTTKVKDEKADNESKSTPSTSKENEKGKTDDKKKKDERGGDSEASSSSDRSFFFLPF